MKKFLSAARTFLSDDSGATMVEYGLMVALVAAVCIGAVTLLGTAINTQFGNVAGSI